MKSIVFVVFEDLKSLKFQKAKTETANRAENSNFGPKGQLISKANFLVLI